MHPALLIEAARKGGIDRGFEEFGSDPVLTLAALGLIAVSIAWLVLSRAIYRNLQRAAELREIKVDRVRPPRDIWKTPPETGRPVTAAGAETADDTQMATERRAR